MGTGAPDDMSDSPELDTQIRRLACLALGKDPSLSSLPGLVERLRTVLFEQGLSEEESELVDQASTAPHSPVVDDLVELRVRHALTTVAGSAGAGGELTATLPNVVLARGDADMAADDESDRPQADREPGEELDRTLGASRVGRSLAHSLGLEMSHEGKLDESKLGSSGTLILTDKSGVKDLEASLSGSGATFHVDKGGEIPVSDGTRKHLNVLELNETLEEVQKVLLWSMPAIRRQELLRKSVRGFSLEGVELAGKYQVGKQLGQGGFGTVYQAWDKILETNVAIKVLNPTIARRKDAMKGFLAEAQRLTALDHPNIVRWITFDRTPDGLHYFVMEFLEGEELAEALKREKVLDAERSGEILLQVLAALRRAHRLADGSSLLHLDLKPQNVFLMPETHSDPERAKVIDFGISRFSRDEDLPDLGDPAQSESTMGTRPHRDSGSGSTTVRRMGGGTVMYASPEQCKHILGDKDIVELDARTDIYALGVMAFEMLTGEYPFPRPTSHLQAIRNHLHVEPFKVLEKNRDVGRKLGAFVDKCLAKDRELRWSSTDEAYQALDRILHPVSSRLKLAAMVGAVAILASAIVWSSVQESPEEQVGFQVSVADRELAVKELGSDSVKLRHGREAVFRPERSPGKVSGLTLLTGGVSSTNFDVRGPNGGAFVIVPKPEAEVSADSAPLIETAKIAWEEGGQRLVSPSFQVQLLPALELMGVDGGAPLEVRGIGEFSDERQMVLGEGLDVILELQDGHRVLENPATRVELVLESGSAPIEFRPLASGGDSARFELQLKPALCKAGDLDTTASVRVTDLFGDTKELPGIPLRLTVQPTSVAVDAVRVQVADGNQLHGIHFQDGSYRVDLPSAAAQPEDLEVRFGGRLGAGNRSTSFELVQRVNGASETLVGEPTIDETGQFEIAFRLPHPPQSVQRIELRVRDEGVVARADGDRAAAAVVNLHINTPRPFESALRGAQATGVEAVELGAAPIHIPASRQVLEVTASGLHDDWLLAVSGFPGEPMHLWVREAESSWDLPELGGDGAELELQLDYYSPSSLPDGLGGLEGAALAAALEASSAQPHFSSRHSLVVVDELQFEVDGLTAWKSEPLNDLDLAEINKTPLVFRAMAGRAPLRRASYELWSDDVKVAGDDLPAGPEGGSFQLDVGARLEEEVPDGPYELVVALVDGLDHSENWSRGFHLNRGGPVIEARQPTASKWRADNDGLYKLQAWIRDGNRINPATVVAVIESDRRPERRIELERAGSEAPIEVIEAAAGGAPDSRQVESGLFTGSLRLGPEDSDSTFTVRFEASDRWGEPGTVSITTSVDEVREHYKETALSKDGTTMLLLHPPAKGTYTFREYGALQGDQKNAYKQALSKLQVHYKSGAEFDDIVLEIGAGDSRSLLPEVREFAKIKPFYLDEHEVSRAQFLRFLDGGGEQVVEQLSAGRAAVLRAHCTAGSPDWPVHDVTWHEADAYARWAGKRLPTHLEWEYAVRGQNNKQIFACQQSPRTETVPLRDGQAGEFAVYAWIGKNQPSPVKERAHMSSKGFYHLCGNVAEWTSTPYAEASGPAAYWVVGADFETRTVPGSSATYWPRYDFKAVELWNADGRQTSMPKVGFRCAVDAKQLQGH